MPFEEFVAKQIIADIHSTQPMPKRSELLDQIASSGIGSGGKLPAATAGG